MAKFPVSAVAPATTSPCTVTNSDISPAHVILGPQGAVLIGRDVALLLSLLIHLFQHYWRTALV